MALHTAYTAYMDFILSIRVTSQKGRNRDFKSLRRRDAKTAASAQVGIPVLQRWTLYALRPRHDYVINASFISSNRQIQHRKCKFQKINNKP